MEALAWKRSGRMEALAWKRPGRMEALAWKRSGRMEALAWKRPGLLEAPAWKAMSRWRPCRLRTASVPRVGSGPTSPGLRVQMLLFVRAMSAPIEANS